MKHYNEAVGGLKAGVCEIRHSLNPVFAYPGLPAWQASAGILLTFIRVKYKVSGDGE
jgi:hypothetical protein